ncbi:MAG: PhzF family phenazine biosynthesis protein [Actinobacteria bacterium]|nr:PhzF family phenazine biosynthesis protein [Actinomycetota bacterium]
MEVRFRLLDVFCDRPFAGNQLCVVPDVPEGLDATGMHTVTREIGFSETTFVTKAGGDRYSMRIFTPGQELPFAGHPTLGTAYLLVAEGRVSSPVIQTTAVGEVHVEIDVEEGFGWMRQRPPVFGPEFPDRVLVARAAGLEVDDLDPDLPPQVVSTGLGPLIAPLRDLPTLRRAERDARATREVCERSGGECLYLFASTEEGVTARMFDPGVGIGEDPATGSAAGPLGAYLASRGRAGMPGCVTVAQGEQIGRPSFLHVEVASGGEELVVRVGGGVRVVGEGVFRL